MFLQFNFLVFILFSPRVSHLVLADPWGFPERPLDIDERYKLPLWAKAIGYVAQQFNPLGILRAAGPLGNNICIKLASYFIIFLGKKSKEVKVKYKLSKKFILFFTDRSYVIATTKDI